MCRLVALLADEPVSLADILTRPTTGLVRQSFASRERAQPGPDGPQQSYEQGCLNGDGYGLGWYVPESCMPSGAKKSGDLSATTDAVCTEMLLQKTMPAVVTSMKPAWNDRNLASLAEKVASPLIFAHVRAAGPSLPVSDATCHPFRAGSLLFMHNGMLAGFVQLQPLLVGELCLHPAAFRVAALHGLIDSAVAFAFLLVELGLGSADEDEIALRDFKPDELLKALARTVQRLCKIAGEANVTEESLLNFVVSDGHCMIACRYAWVGAGAQSESEDSGPLPEPPQASLYLTTGTQWAVPPGGLPGKYRMQQADKRSRMAILSSEPLTGVKEEWLTIPRDTFIVCTRAFDPNSSGTVDVLLVPFKKILAEHAGHVCPVRSLTNPPEFVADETRKDGPAGNPADVNGSVDRHVEVLATDYSGIGESPVLCITTVPPSGIFVVGSQDGALRFFASTGYQGQPEIRHHSGPVLALLVTSGPRDVPSLPRPSSELSLASPPPSPKIAPKSPKSSSPRTWSPLTVPTPCKLLFSGSTNEVRVWDVSCCVESGSPAWGGLVCLFCFKFTPNLGRVLSFAGDCDLLFMGFQSSGLCGLTLSNCWSDLFGMKSKSRSVRFLTFDLTRAEAPAFTDCGSSTAKRFCHHSMLSEHRAHLGGIHALAYHKGLKILSSAGSDGMLNFWRAEDRCARCDSAGSRLRSSSEGSLSGQSAAPSLQQLSLSACYCEGRPIFALALDEMAEELYTGNATGNIRVWGLRSAAGGAGRKTAFGPRLDAAILVLHLICKDPGGSRQYRWLLSGDTAGCVRIWDVLHGALLQVLDGVNLDCCSALCSLEKSCEGAPMLVACGGTIGGAHIFGGDAHGSMQSLKLHQVNAACHIHKSPSGTIEGRDEQALLTSLLQQFVAIQSHSGRPDQLRRAASWLQDLFERMLGASVRVCADGTVLARCGWEAGRPLVVMYSHYDVVPAGAGWETDPWTLTGRDGRLFGRGTTDCKGPLLAQIFAARRLLRNRQVTEAERGTQKRESEAGAEFFLSGWTQASADEATSKADVSQIANILFVVDAASESGSPGLLAAIQEASDQGWLGASARAGSEERCKAPVGLLVTNSTWIDDDHPGICYGMRGLVDLVLRVSTGGNRDVHTGRAGLLSEPFLDLAALLASLVDASGRVLVPGFEDKVRKLPDMDRQNIMRVVDVVGSSQLLCLLKESLGLTADDVSSDSSDSRAAGMATLKHAWTCPALSIISVESGANTASRLIPREASALISIRTVPDQEAPDLVAAVKSHLSTEFAKRRTGNKLQVEERCAFKWWEGSACGPECSKLFQIARRGVQQAWSLPSANDVLAVREGGTMPMLPALQAVLGCDAVQIPLGQASDAAHLPNERISEENLSRGVDTLWRTLLHLGQA